MLTTVEVDEQVRQAWNGSGFEERQAYRAAVAELEAEWREWLFQEHADDMSTEAAQVVFARAWEEGHASGYSEVEMHFVDLIGLVREVNRINNV